MSQNETNQRYVIVAFRYNQANSILYHKCDTIRQLTLDVAQALETLQADVISIRRVYEKCPIPQRQT